MKDSPRRTAQRALSEDPLKGSEENPLVFAGWEYWIASDGAVCVDTHGETGTALSWPAFERLVQALSDARVTS